MLETQTQRHQRGLAKIAGPDFEGPASSDAPTLGTLLKVLHETGALLQGLHATINQHRAEMLGPYPVETTVQADLKEDAGRLEALNLTATANLHNLHSFRRILDDTIERIR